MHDTLYLGYSLSIRCFLSTHSFTFGNLLIEKIRDSKVTQQTHNLMFTNAASEMASAAAVSASAAPTAGFQRYYKIVLLGDASAGRSSLIRLWTTNTTCIQHLIVAGGLKKESTTTTTTAAAVAEQVTRKQVGLDFFDLCEPDLSSPDLHRQCADASAFVLVADASAASSLASAAEFASNYFNIECLDNKTAPVPMFLVVTKCDSWAREITKQSAEAVVKRVNDSAASAAGQANMVIIRAVFQVSAADPTLDDGAVKVWRDIALYVGRHGTARSMPPDSPDSALSPSSLSPRKSSAVAAAAVAGSEGAELRAHIRSRSNSKERRGFFGTKMHPAAE